MGVVVTTATYRRITNQGSDRSLFSANTETIDNLAPDDFEKRRAMYNSFETEQRKAKLDLYRSLAEQNLPLFGDE